MLWGGRILGAGARMSQVAVAGSGQCAPGWVGDWNREHPAGEGWMSPIPARVSAAAVKGREYLLKRADAFARAEEC